jgi:hypothetical protein
LLGAARSNPTMDHMTWFGGGARYIYPALMLFFWAALLSIATSSLKVSKVLGGAFAVVMLLASASRFPATVFPVTTITQSDTEYVMQVAPNWTAHVPRTR